MELDCRRQRVATYSIHHLQPLQPSLSPQEEAPTRPSYPTTLCSSKLSCPLRQRWFPSEAFPCNPVIDCTNLHKPSPSIQGVDAEKGTGLGRTLFERLAALYGNVVMILYADCSVSHAPFYHVMK